MRPLLLQRTSDNARVGCTCACPVTGKITGWYEKLLDEVWPEIAKGRAVLIFFAEADPLNQFYSLVCDKKKGNSKKGAFEHVVILSCVYVCLYVSPKTCVISEIE